MTDRADLSGLLTRAKRMLLEEEEGWLNASDEHALIRELRDALVACQQDVEAASVRASRLEQELKDMRAAFETSSIDEERKLRAQVSRLEQELKDASTALDELAAPDSGKSLDARIRDEFHDFQMVIQHCSEIYDNVTMGRISKPTTLPSEVLAVFNDIEQENIRESVKEETEELSAQVSRLHAALRKTSKEWKERAECGAALRTLMLGWKQKATAQREQAAEHDKKFDHSGNAHTCLARARIYGECIAEVAAVLAPPEGKPDA